MAAMQMGQLNRFAWLKEGELVFSSFSAERWAL